MKHDTIEHVKAARAELDAAYEKLKNLNERLNTANQAANDTTGQAALDALQAERSALLAELFQADLDPASDDRLAELDKQIAETEAQTKASRDRAEGARIVSQSLTREVQAATASMQELNSKFQGASLAAMHHEIGALADAYRAACDDAGKAYAQMQAAMRIHGSLALSMGRGALGSLLSPTLLEFSAPGITPTGRYCVETREHIVQAQGATREAWLKAGLFVPAN
jgi:hypothetical protein